MPVTLVGALKDDEDWVAIADDVAEKLQDERDLGDWEVLIGAMNRDEYSAFKKGENPTDYIVTRNIDPDAKRIELAIASDWDMEDTADMAHKVAELIDDAIDPEDGDDDLDEDLDGDLDEED